MRAPLWRVLLVRSRQRLSTDGSHPCLWPVFSLSASLRVLPSSLSPCVMIVDHPISDASSARIASSPPHARPLQLPADWAGVPVPASPPHAPSPPAASRLQRTSSADACRWTASANVRWWSSPFEHGSSSRCRRSPTCPGLERPPRWHTRPRPSGAAPRTGEV